MTDRWLPAAFCLLLAGCGEEPAPIAQTVLGLGAVPARVASLSVSVFDDEGLVVSATVSPPRPALDLGVPAEVPLQFQIVARTATPAPAGFGGGLPAFVAREGRIIPLTRQPVQVALEARPAGGLQLQVRASADVPPGDLVVRSLDGVPGVSFRIGAAVPRRLSAVLGRGLQELTYEPDTSDTVVPIRRGTGLWVAAETISTATIFLGRTVLAPELVLSVLRADGTPLAPVAGAEAFEALRLDVAWADDRAGDPARPVTLEVRSTGTAMLEGLPSEILGVPQVLTGLSASGVGRIEIRARADEDLGAIAVFNVGGPGEDPAGLALAVANPASLADGSGLEVWTVDAVGRLTTPPTGTLSLAASDPWVVRPDGDVVALSPIAADARVVLRIALPSRPVDRSAFVQADLASAEGTLSARLGLR